MKAIAVVGRAGEIYATSGARLSGGVLYRHYFGSLPRGFAIGTLIALS